METYLTPQQVADKLQLTVQTVYQWIKDGELPAVKMKRVYRITQGDLDRFLADRATVKGSNEEHDS
jgi:excisionase family DNA binding protein